MLTILNPVAAAADIDGASMPTVSTLKGLTVGILTNHWKSMDKLSERIALRLKEDYGVYSVRTYDVPINGAMAEAVRESVLAECQVAIVGLAN